MIAEEDTNACPRCDSKSVQKEIPLLRSPAVFCCPLIIPVLSFSAQTQRHNLVQIAFFEEKTRQLNEGQTKPLH